MSAIAFNGEIFPSGARAASDQVYDNSTTGLPANVQGALDKTTGNISSLGTVELTATAAHAHVAGSTFLWIGQLVKATAAIAVGDTIANSGVGANVEDTSIVNLLIGYDQYNLPEPSSGNNFRPSFLRLYPNGIKVCCAFVASCATDQVTLWSNIPEKYRPYTNATARANGNDISNTRSMTILTDGNIIAHAAEVQNIGCVGQIFYV